MAEFNRPEGNFEEEEGEKFEMAGEGNDGNDGNTEGEADTAFNEQDYGDVDDDENLDDVNVDGMDDMPEFDGEEFEKLFFQKGGEKFKETMEQHRLEKLKAKQSYLRKAKLRVVNEIKEFYRKNFNQEILIGDGKKGTENASRKLIENLYIEHDKKTGSIKSILFDGKKIFARDGKKGFRLSEKGAKDVVAKFKRLRAEAAIEHSKTANATIEKELGNLPGSAVVNEIRNAVTDDLQDEITMMMDNIESINGIQDGGESSKQTDGDKILAELAGILDPKGDTKTKLESVEVNKPYYEDLLKTETDPRMKELIKSVLKVVTLKADQLRLEENLEPQEEETKEKIKNNIIVRFEKFKEWVKENMGATAAITISVAGIITTLALGLRKGVTTAAKATGALAKGLAKLGKELLPILAPLVSILVTALSMGAKGLAWLAKNLWVLAIGLGYIMYEKYGKRLQ